MRQSFLWVAGLGALLTAASCQKVINLKVGDSTPQVVVEGLITDREGPRVRLSRTVNFTEPNTFPPVTDARMWVTDQTVGRTDTLRYAASLGYYVPYTSYVGQPGHTYRMVVELEGNTYMATTTLPQPVYVDSVRVEVSAAFGRKAAQIFTVFTDPPGVPNYYRISLFANGKRRGFDTRDDRYTDGRVNGRPSILGYDDEEGIGAGTVVEVELACIDTEVYKYFSTLRNADGNSAAPANPVTNIQGGAQGYFGAFSIQRRTIVLP